MSSISQKYNTDKKNRNVQHCIYHVYIYEMFSNLFRKNVKDTHAVIMSVRVICDVFVCDFMFLTFQLHIVLKAHEA